MPFPTSARPPNAIARSVGIAAAQRWVLGEIARKISAGKTMPDRAAALGMMSALGWAIVAAISNPIKRKKIASSN
jgi:hypothetical protein